MVTKSDVPRRRDLAMQRSQGTSQTKQSAPCGPVIVLITCPCCHGGLLTRNLGVGEEGGGSLAASASSYFISHCPYIIILSWQLSRSVVGGENVSGLGKGPGRLMEDRAISRY